MHWRTGYFKVDLDIVWKTVERDLPILMSTVREVIETAAGTPNP